MKYQILNGDNIEILKTLPENSVDSIITDPPYGIAFLGKEWDHKRATETTSKIAQLHNLPSGMKHTTLADDLEFQYWLRERWIECLRVLKPGGQVLAFSAARTYHHMAMSLQTAGFEIRDQIMWIYSSGFPKSQDVGKSIDRAAGKRDPNYTGMVKSPNKVKGDLNDTGTNAFGAGVYCPKCEKTLNVDIVKQCKEVECAQVYRHQTAAGQQWAGWGTALKPAHEPIALARKPIKLSIAKNAQKWGVGALNIDACRIGDDPMIVRHLKKDDGKAFTHHGDGKKNWDTYEDIGTVEGRFPSNVVGEILQADYQKYFYCPKVSRRERHIGFDNPDYSAVPQGIDGGTLNTSGGLNHDRAKYVKDGNNHPTVKPVALMEYLIKLVTPPGGTVLDPFNGSGSTGMAAVELGHEYIGIEQDANYCEISKKRIEAWLKIRDPLRASGLFT